MKDRVTVYLHCGKEIIAIIDSNESAHLIDCLLIKPIHSFTTSSGEQAIVRTENIECIKILKGV